MKRILLLCVVSMITFSVSWAQRTVTGTVTGEDDGTAVPGVNVIVKGTSAGTVTDIDGKYQIGVPEEGGTLVFSFIGLTTEEVEIGNQSTINMVMTADIKQLTEVVVTALGVSREKQSLGYASQGVSSEDLTAANDANPLTALSGKVAGLNIAGQNFGGSQNVLIRGASSFSQNNQPLFVVDGVPVSNEGFNTTSTQTGGGGYDYGSMINDLNSYDIENIEVLKGSAASALYGSRGQNGVIMITTKAGKAGKKSFSVELNTGMNFEDVYILPKQQKMYGGGAGDFGTATIDGVEYRTVAYAVDESWGPRYEGQDVLHWWGVYDYEQGLTSTPQTGPWQASPNDVDAFYETGIAYQNSLNMVATNENSALRIGYTNISKTGVVPNSTQNKNTFNINASSAFLDKFLEVNANVTYVNTETKGRPQFGYGDNSQSQKFFQWGQRQLDMNRLSTYLNPDGTMRTWNRKSLTDPTPKYSDNPYWTAYKNYQDDDRTRIFGTAGLKLNLTDFLSLQGNAYLDTYNFNARERVSKGSQAQSFYGQYQRQATETNFEGKINFNKRFGDFDISAFAGGNIRQDHYRRFQGETNGGLVVDGLYNLNNSANAPLLDDYLREKKVNSYFAAASVGFKDLVYVDATYRKDFDSTLPNDNNSYGYASVSGSFIASELIAASWLNNLKVRMNYGETGNGTSPYQIFNTYAISDPFNGSPQFTNYGQLNNQNLQPEFTKEVEVGIEGALFESRLGFDLSWYDRNTENQIVPIEISGSAGYTSQVINAGLINNSGVEVVLFGTPVRTRNFSWDITVNYAKNTNEVKDLPEEVGDKIQLASAPFGGAYLNSVEGATFQELYAFNYVYDDNGNKVINQSSGFYERGELESLGSVLPDFTMGIKNSFSIYGFDLGALIDMSQGGKYYSLTHAWAMYSGMDEKTALPTSGGNTIREDGIVLEGVTPEGNVNEMNISASAYGGNHYHGFGTPSATSVFDASYVKLREVTLGYTIPQFTTAIKSIRVSLYGRNLAVWGLGNEGIDPETVVGGNGNIQGLEGGIIPATRNYGFNVQFKF
jgi:TonB-linked SusC/RagA family outer membrane protein